MAKWTLPEGTSPSAAPEVGDGRPCATDIFLVHILEHEDDHYDLRDRLKDWVEGAWDDALEGLPDLDI